MISAFFKSVYSFFKKPVRAKCKPEFIFLWFSLVFGTILVFLIPPGHIPDEQAHVFRAYQVSCGKFYPDKVDGRPGVYLPPELAKIAFHWCEPTTQPQHITISDLKKYLFQPAQDSTIFLPIGNTTIYSPLVYAPQALGILVCRVLKTPPLIMIFAGRLISLWFWIGLLFFAIRLMPFGKWLWVMLSLIPQNLFMGAAISADCVVISVSFFATALLLNAAYDEKREINRQLLIWILISVVALTLSKNVYVLIPGLFFLVPRQKFYSAKQYWFFSAVLTGCVFAMLLMNASITESILKTINPITSIYGSAESGLPQIDPRVQLNLIISDPLDFIIIVLNSFRINYLLPLYSTIGNFGWLDAPLPAYHIYLYWILLFVYAFTDGNAQLKIPLLHRFLTSIIITGSVFIFSIAMYLSWNNVGDRIIGNLQGRYFIPFLPLFFLLFYSRKFRFPERIFCFGTILISFLSLLSSVITILNRYYFTG